MILIDWDNIPPCSAGLTVSPHICVEGGDFPTTPPPTGSVPVAGSLPLIILGVAVMRMFTNKTKGK